MTERKSGLGRGLDDLLAGASLDPGGVDDASMEADIVTPSVSEPRLLEFYELMLTGRLLETRLIELHGQGEISGPLHPAVGEEAAMVGFAGSLADGDVFAGTHRDLVAQLARGVTLEETLLNVFGKAAGPTRGRDGGSLFGVFDKGTLMAVAGIPDAYPVAVGCALAFAQKGERQVAMAACGEGAAATGTWHEAIHLAAALNLPVVFTVRNDGPGGEAGNGVRYIAHRADAYGIPGIVVDGSDIVEIASVTAEAVERARGGGGPTLIEAITARRDVLGADDDRWTRFDPLPRLEEYLGTKGLLDEQRRRHLSERIEDRVRRTLDWARTQAEPLAGEVSTDLFAIRVVPETAASDPSGPPVSMAEALETAVREEMSRDERVFVMGEYDESFEALDDTFGPGRVIGTPNTPTAIVGAAIGAGLQGMRPVARIRPADLADLRQLGQAATYHWKAGRQVPIVVRARVGSGAGPHRSRSREGALTHEPGIKVVMPSTPAALHGLMIGAIRDPNPVVLLEHRGLFAGLLMPISDGHREIPIGQARVARSGEEITIVTWGAMVHTCEAAAAVVGDGVVEIVDLQTLNPIDWDTVFTSIEKTTRLVVVQEDVPFAGVASEVAAVAAEELFWDLEAPVRRVTPPHIHVPYSGVLEEAFVPGVEDVVEVVRQLATT